MIVEVLKVLLIFLCGIIIGWCSFFFGIIPTDDDEGD